MVGHPGLSFTQVDGICRALKNYGGNNHPRYLVVHAGGNDFGWLNARALRQLMMKTMSNLMSLFPNTCIVWSNILPRLQWWYSENIEAMENIRSRTNRALIKHMILNGGNAIKHPDFNDKLRGCKKILVTCLSLAMIFFEYISISFMYIY